MKIKLKDDKMERYNGFYRRQFNALNKGEVIEVDEIPLEAEPFIIEIKEKPKAKTKKESK
tara:strand:- start:886 stop:1065 length:180 start_codon:yes stop_codon:yes gene_type:complete